MNTPAPLAADLPPTTDLDRPMFDAIDAELRRQQTQIELIASENIVSAAKGLHADHLTDHVAIDVHLADASAGGDPARGRLDARMHAERQPEARRIDHIDHVIDIARPHVDDGTEHFAREYVR